MAFPVYVECAFCRRGIDHEGADCVVCGGTGEVEVSDAFGDEAVAAGGDGGADEVLHAAADAA